MIWDSLIESTPDIVVTFDMKGYVLYCNPAARKTLGIGVDQREAHLQIGDIFPRQVHEHILGGGILTAILDGVWSGETLLLSRSGQEIPVSQVIVAPSGPDGKCEFLSMIARDISHIKLKEEELRQSVKFYRDIVQHAVVGIWIIDDENRTRFANDKMASILGYEPEEMIGIPAADVIDNEPVPLANCSTLLNDIPDSRAYQLLGKNGARVRLNLSTSSVFDEQEQFAGTLVVAAGLDDTRGLHGQALLWSDIAQNARLPV
jgi:PAS domain S-box-containing protein